jgi:hypothetical protein
MTVDANAVARRLATLFQSDFEDGKTKGRFAVDKATLRLLAGGVRRLEGGTLARVAESAFERHGLVLVPLDDGTIDKADSFGVMKKDPAWRTVPEALAKAVARS